MSDLLWVGGGVLWFTLDPQHSEAAFDQAEDLTIKTNHVTSGFTVINPSTLYSNKSPYQTVWCVCVMDQSNFKSP